MKKTLLIVVIFLLSSSLAACSSAKARPEPLADPAPVVEERSTAPADLGASSSGRGL